MQGDQEAFLWRAGGAKLAGKDSDWVAAGKQQQAFYTGTYRFYLRAVNESGAPSAEITPVNIVIPPTFVQSATSGPALQSPLSSS